MDVLKMTYPGHPCGKGRARSTRSGRHYTPAKTESNEAYIRLQAAQAMQDKEIEKGAVEIYIRVYFAIPASATKKVRQNIKISGLRPTKKPDVDNIVKSIFDAFNGIVWLDDTQVVSASISKYYTDDAPRTEIEVRSVFYAQCMED